MFRTHDLVIVMWVLRMTLLEVMRFNMFRTHDLFIVMWVLRMTLLKVMRISKRLREGLYKGDWKA